MSNTLTKQDVSNLVNALPESSFQDCTGISFRRAPGKIDRAIAGMGMGLVVVGSVALALITVAMVADVGIDIYKRTSQWAKERKAKKDASIHKTLDEGKPGPSEN